MSLNMVVLQVIAPSWNHSLSVTANALDPRFPVPRRHQFLPLHIFIMGGLDEYPLMIHTVPVTLVPRHVAPFVAVGHPHAVANGPIDRIDPDANFAVLINRNRCNRDAAAP